MLKAMGHLKKDEIDLRWTFFNGIGGYPKAKTI
jgi:hypothetical protein